MSLILDALEQADHERRGQPPPERSGSATVANTAAASKDPSSRLGGLWWTAGGVALALTSVLAWERWGPDTPPPPAVQRPLATDTARLPAVPVAAVPPPSGTAPSAPAAGTALFKPPPLDVAPASPPAPVTVAAAAGSGATESRAAAPATLTPPPVPLATQPPEPASAPAPTFGELPDEVRARLPSLNITGHTYSDNPTLRTLMVDGRMLVEGQTLSPGLRLERIERHQAVFSQRGIRFSVGF